MSESRKKHLDIDGGTVKEDDHIATYKPIPESDTEPRNVKSNLSKSKEKITDEAEEKLLSKSEEAKITTRVDMADAKYVVGDHRNGDAKIELDASKRQFTGLTKEELMKYAEDPFWVRVRWTIFILFWVLWLAMLAGAIAIIVGAPKCTLPTPKTWYQKGPLVDLAPEAVKYDELDTSADVESWLSSMKEAQVQGVFIPSPGDAYRVLEDQTAAEQVKKFVNKAKDYGVRVIIDLTANFVSKTHKWFELSENNTAGYGEYFTWAKSKGFDDASQPIPPNNWRSTLNSSAWSWSESRKEFYLHQYGDDQPDLNFHNPEVVKQFDQVLKTWMKTGIAGIRLVHARQLLVDSTLAEEEPVSRATDAVHTDYAYYQHRHTTDHPQLDQLLTHWAHIVDADFETPGANETVFTLLEQSYSPRGLHVYDRNLTVLRPPSVLKINIDENTVQLAATIKDTIKNWPALEFTSDEELAEEVAAFAMLLPAAPVLTLPQIQVAHNITTESLSRLSSLRHDSSLEHGEFNVTTTGSALNTSNAQMLVCTRWKTGHTGYAAVLNPHSVSSYTSLAEIPAVPAQVTVYYVTHKGHELTNYTINEAVDSNNLFVSAKTTVVVSFVPKTAVEK